MFYVYADGQHIYNPLDEHLTIHSPKVTLEIGKAGSFQFNIPPTNDFYSRLEQLKTTIVVEYGDKYRTTELFRGRVLSISKSINKVKTVYCEGVLAYLVDTVQKAKSYKGTAGGLFRKIITNHNKMVGEEKQFSVGRITVDTDTQVVIPGKKDDDDKYYTSKYAQAVIESIADEWLTTFDYINDVLIDYLGGYLVARSVKQADGSIKNYIDYLSDDELFIEDTISPDPSASTAPVRKQIEFGVNLLDINEELSADDLCTVIIPLGDTIDDEVITIEKASNVNNNGDIKTCMIDGKRIGLYSAKAVNKYGKIVKTHPFQNVNSANTLYTDGKKWLQNHRNIPVRYTIKAVDLRFIDPSVSKNITLGEMVSVRSDPHNIDMQLICTKVEYDLENPANNAYTLGNPEQSLTERYKKNKKKQDKDSKRRAAKAGGKSAASAKEDAVEDATSISAEDTNQKLEDFRTEWIDVEPGSGHITLGTAWQAMIDGKMKLKTMSGIDLDSDDQGSSVNIYAMNTLIGSNGRKIGENEAKISVVANDLESHIALSAQYQKDTNTAISGLNLKATEDRALLDLFTKYEKKADGSISMSTIKLDSGKLYSSIKSTTEYNGDFEKSRTGIEQWATNTFAGIAVASQYKTDISTAKTEITQFCNSKFATIAAVAEYQTADATARAAIDAKASRAESVLKLFTDYTVDKNGNVDVKSQTAIDAMSTKLFSRIKATTEYDNGVTKSISYIKNLSNGYKSALKLFTSFTVNDDGTVHDAKIDLSADAESSIVQIAADQIKLSGFVIADDSVTVKKNLYVNKEIHADNGIAVSGSLSFYSGSTIKASGVEAHFSSNTYIGDSDLPENKVATKKDLAGITLSSLGYEEPTFTLSYNTNVVQASGDPKTLADYINAKIKAYVTASYINGLFDKSHEFKPVNITASGTIKAKTVEHKLSDGDYHTLLTVKVFKSHKHSFSLPGHTHKLIGVSGYSNTGAVDGKKSGDTNTP